VLVIVLVQMDSDEFSISCSCRKFPDKMSVCLLSNLRGERCWSALDVSYYGVPLNGDVVDLIRMFPDLNQMNGLFRVFPIMLL